MHAPLALAWLMGPACQAPRPSSDDAAPRFHPTLPLVQALRAGGAAPLSPAWTQARRGPPPPAPAADPLASLGAELTGGRFDESRGLDMVEALTAFPSDEVEQWGAGVFTLTELYGNGDFDGASGLCEDPHALFQFEDGGEEWEASLRMFGLLQLVEPVTAMWMTLTETCAAGVDAAGGDVDAAVDAGTCSEQEQHGFFPDDGDCAACVAEGQTVQACQDEGACLVEAPFTDSYGAGWYRWAETEVVACAPDIRMKLYFAANDMPDDGTVAGSWDHRAWRWLCFGIRDEVTGEVERSCVGDGDGTTELGDGYGDGVVTRVDWIRSPGSTDTPHAERVGWNRRLTFEDGTSTERFVLSYGGIGQISTPLITEDGNGDGVVDDLDWGFGYGGWGFNPLELRPDGTNPDDLDDTYARDWLAAVVLKMATTRDGVPINAMNHSRCLEWVGPHADGSYTCVENGTPALGWYEDNHVFWYNSGMTRVIVEPLMTIGSTGLPDELVPGGFTPLIAGTPGLAKPDWDDCTWPHSFVPDHIRTEDDPLDWGGVASLDAHTYKFGKDPDLDLRVVMAVTQARGFCPEGD